MSCAELHPEAIPAELRMVPQWVTWRHERRGGKLTKVPYAPTTGRRASATDPSTWRSFDGAIRACRRGRYNGVGFVFCESDPYCGIDLDDSVDDTGVLRDDARRIVDRLSTYTEISPSGRGLKLFLRGRLPTGGNRKGKVEMYDRGRYFTVTGRRLPGTPGSVEDRQPELEALHAETFAASVHHRPLRVAVVRCVAGDEELLARARSAKNGRKFMRLFYLGDISAYGGDDSAADLALCGLLAFWCGRDPARIDRLFRRSALMREKWDSRRAQTSYGARTIDAALRTRCG